MYTHRGALRIFEKIKILSVPVTLYGPKNTVHQKRFQILKRKQYLMS